MTSPYPTPQELLPHAPPMLALDEILSYDEECIECAATLQGSPLMKGGQGRAVIVLEPMAQAAGAFAGLRAAWRDDRIRGGYLVGIREMRLSPVRLNEDDRLTVTVILLTERALLARFHCRAARDAESVAEAVVEVHRGQTHRGTE